MIELCPWGLYCSCLSPGGYDTASAGRHFWLLGGGGGKGERRRIDREFGMDLYTLLYLKQITNKDLLYSTENSAQNSTIT